MWSYYTATLTNYAHLRQWECLAMLQADGVMKEHHDRRANALDFQERLR